MRIVVHVDPEKCCASGGCASLAPEHFELGELGYATPAKSEYAVEDLDVLKEAEANCPYAAIGVEIADDY